MILIRNGLLVTPVSTIKTDVLIEGEKVKAIGNNLTVPENCEIIDAKGKYVLPGAIDVHTHMEMPFGGTVSADDFKDGSIAAVMGGVTTFIDFAIQNKGVTLEKTLKDHRAKADPKVICDYGIHLAITDLNDNVMSEIPQVIKEGYPTFKLFMTYPGLAVDDYTLFQTLKVSKASGGMVSVHAENISMITKGVAKLLSEGKTTPEFHEVSRQDYVEAEAISRAIQWSEETGGRLYIVHLSTKKGLDLVKAAQARGVDVLAETCPQYLTLTKERYLEPNFEGAKYVMSPPLRNKPDNEALWKGLAEGFVKTVASDHCPFNMEQKKMGLKDFSKIPNGAPGIETILMILHTEGVLKNRITLNKMVEITAFNPAKVFGLADKGILAPGKDADVVIFDPELKRTLSWKNLHTHSDNIPFEGWDVTGAPVLTMVRGKVVMKDGELLAKPGDGKFQSRKLS